ncbi:MAG: helix-turn-helix domain-containing protein [Nanoarchaeota archaeon]|nr:helix-turn-helix domain-containing protein [Nanoarchaeota archaeon]
MDLQKNLELLGLTKTESTIYLSLLKIGEATAVKLAKETSVHRRTIYDNLNILLKKGLVNFAIKNNVKYFKATNPLAFQGFLEEKEKILSNTLPSLNSFYQNKQTSPQINIHVGIQGAKSIIEEAIQTNKTLYWVGSGLSFFDAIGFSRKFIEEKLSKTTIKIIQTETLDIKAKLKIFKKENIRLLPKKYLSSIGYLIYDNIVVIGLIQEKEITMIKLTSKDFTTGFKNYFDIMWQIGKKI